MSPLSPTLLLLLLVVVCTVLVSGSPSPSPGHMQHKYYQDQERERVRQRASRKADWEEFHNGGEGGEGSLLVLGVMAALVWALGV